MTRFRLHEAAREWGVPSPHPGDQQNFAAADQKQQTGFGLYTPQHLPLLSFLQGGSTYILCHCFEGTMHKTLEMMWNVNSVYLSYSTCLCCKSMAFGLILRVLCECSRRVQQWHCVSVPQSGNQVILLWRCGLGVVRTMVPVAKPVLGCRTLRCQPEPTHFTQEEVRLGRVSQDVTTTQYLQSKFPGCSF